MRGAYLSGLVYPGLGQMAQKHYARGIALICIATASFMITLLAISKQIGALLANLESGSGDLDITTLATEITKLTPGQDGGSIRLSSALMVLCWGVGIVDAYLAGKKLDHR